jgi:hypothetical protein
MEIDEFKSAWKEAGVKAKDRQELQKMADVNTHASFRRMRTKFIVEGVLLTIFLVLYYDGFDGYAKPLWANIILVISLLTYIGVRFAGCYLLSNPVGRSGSLKESLVRFRAKLKRMAIAVVITSLLFGAALILFFATGIEFTGRKWMAVAAMALTLCFLVILSGRRWQARIEDIDSVLLEFNDVAG